MARLPDRDSKRIGKIEGMIRIIAGIFIAIAGLTIYTIGYIIHKAKKKTISFLRPM